VGYASDQFSGLSEEMTAADDSSVRHLIHEYWLTLAGRGRRFLAAIDGYLASSSSSSDCAVEFASLMGSANTHDYGLDGHVIATQKFAEGSLTIRGEPMVKPHTARWGVVEVSSETSTRTRLLELRMVQFYPDWTVNREGTEDIADIILRDGDPSATLVIIALPWMPAIASLPHGQAARLAAAGRRVIVFSPAAFGVWLTLLIRRFVPVSAAVEFIEEAPVEPPFRYVGIREVGQLLELRQDPIPVPIRERLARFFEVRPE